MNLKKGALITLILIFNLTYPDFVLSKERLAVMNLKAQHGVEKSIADALSVEVRNGIHDLGAYEVLSRDDLDVLAERTAIIQKVDCEATSQCLIDFGRKIGTKYLVAGSISKMGETYTINLRLLDTEGQNAGVKQRADKKCKCSEDELIDTAREVAKTVMQYNLSQKAKFLDKDALNNELAPTVASQHESSGQPEIKEEESWLSKYKWWIAAGVVLAAGGAAVANGGDDGDEPVPSQAGSATINW